MQHTKLIDAYNAVFTLSGCMKPCNRETCINLLRECYKMVPEGSWNFGDLEYGFLNVNQIKEFISLINPEIPFREAFFSSFDENGNRISCKYSDEEKLISTTMDVISFYNLGDFSDYDYETLRKLYLVLFPAEENAG